MHLEKLFRLYLGQAKSQALTLLDNDRRKACQWIKKIELAPVPEEEDKIIQLHALKLLLLCLESNCFTGPFEESPVDEKEITEYDWNSYPLNNFANMIRSKKDCDKSPDVSYAVSGNRRELVTYRNDPDTGQHCYYACSREPIEEWENLEGGAVRNESIKNWQERGELEELNQHESQNSSIDVPRCVRNIPSPELDFCVHDERHSDLRGTNKSLNATPGPGPSRPQNYQRIQTERPETPQRFGGRAVNRPYGNEEFGISQNEQFRSPRGVFENLDYDQFQVRRGPRLTDEIIDSFEYAKARLAPSSEAREESNQQHKQDLRARLLKIRNDKNQKPQRNVVEQQIEDEPETFHYEPITLQEPSDEIGNSSRHQNTGKDQSILSSVDMNDEDMFGEQRTIDPRTIFKAHDENLVSRNVVKIETNTKISGSKREVTEEILEEEDVNVQQRTETNENLEDVSEPVFESPPGYSPLQFQDRTPIRPRQVHRQPKPRRIDVHYSDLPREDLEDIAQPSFQQDSVSQSKEGTIPHSFARNRGNKSEFVSQPCTTTDQPESHPQRRLQQAYASERLDDIEQPDFCSSFGNSRLTGGHGFSYNTRNSEHLEDICPPDFPSSFEDPSRRGRVFPEFNDSERLDSVSHPIYPSSFENTSKQEQFPQMEKSERLDSIEPPDLQSFQESTVQSRRSNCPSKQRALPQVEESEMLENVCQPDFQSLKDSTSHSRGRKGVSVERPMSYAETSERLDQLTPPGFQSTLRSSTLQSRRNGGRSPYNRIPPLETSETLHQVSHLAPLSLGDSINKSRKSRRIHESERLCDVSQANCEDSMCRTGRRNFKQPSIPHERLDDVSQPDLARSFDCSMQRSGRSKLPPQQSVELERLEDVSQPNFQYSQEDSKNISADRRCLQERRALPYVDVSERLESVCQPDFSSSVKDSTRSSGRNKCRTQHKPFHQVTESDMLDDVDHPNFSSILQESSQGGRVPQQRYRSKIHTSEVLEDVSQPIYHSTFENRTQRPRPMLDQINKSTLKENEDINQQKSFGRSMPRQGRMQPERRLPQCIKSELLDDVIQPDFQSSFENSRTGQTSRVIGQTQQRRPQHIFDASEKLNDVTQLFLPTSFEDSSRISSGRQVSTAKNLEEMSIPTFHSSLEEPSNRSRCNKNKSMQRPFHQIEESERLEDVTQPAYPSSFVHSTAISSGQNFQNRRPWCNADGSENLNEIRPPNFPSSFEDSKCTPMQRSGRNRITRHQQLGPEEDRERLDDVCQPEFPMSFESSRCCSVRNKFGNIQKSFPSENLENVNQPDFSCSLDRSAKISCDGMARSLQTQGPRFNPCEMSGRNRNMPQQKYCAAADISERLDDVCQPEFPTSFEDSRYCSKRNKSRPLQKSQPGEVLENKARCLQEKRHQFDDSEMLEEVIEPEFPTTFQDESSLNKSGGNKNMVQQRYCPEVENSERLDDVRQPDFPSSIKDSRHCSRSRSRPLQKSLPGEILDDISQPDFQCTIDRSLQRTSENNARCLQEQQPQFDPCEMSGRNRNTHQKRYHTRADISERLDDVCQPEFPTSFEDSRSNKSRPLQTSLPTEILEDITKPNLSCSIDRSMQRSSENSARLQLDASDMLEDVIEPEFPSTFQDESSLNRSGRNKSNPQRRYCPDTVCSERLEDDRQPEFVVSRHFSRGNRSRPLQKSFPSEVLDDITQPNCTCSLDRSRQRSSSSDNRRKRLPFQRFQYDNSVMLEDIVEPEFPSTFQDSANISRERRKTNPEQKHLPQVDISENLESVCQPEYPMSFEDSENVPSTYRKIVGSSSNYPEEYIDNVSAPTFHSDNQDPHSHCLPAENVDSHGSSRRRLEDRRSRGPQRQIFPKQKLTIVDTERLGDYKQVFQSMPNYAPFEEQIVPARNPPTAPAAFSSRLKMPGTFGQTMVHSARNNEPLRNFEMQFPHQKMQPAQISKIKRGPCAMPYTQMRTQPIADFCPNKPCKFQIHSIKNNISPKTSSTKIGLPGGRSQTKIQRPQHRSIREIMPVVDQERLVKKSLVKFQITKSTFSKNQQDKSKRSQSERR